jgi:succinate-semialdehyde dehydrogenase/glutarate-semialdehyde dehydrogenase
VQNPGQTIQNEKIMTYQSVNPFDGKAGEKFEKLTDAQLETALETAANCFEKWRRTTFAERGAIASKAASLMRERIDELAPLVTLEMGKLISEARGEVKLTAGVLDYYAENAERFLAPEPLKPLSGEAWIESAPLGVLLGIQVWNLPYHLLARFAAPNLMAGNVVMVKHAESLPQCALAFEKSDFGLAASIFTRDVTRGQRLASRLNTGMVFINQPTLTSPELPFGGIGDSGYGRNLSSMGIQEFVKKKLVRVASIDDPA